LSTGRGRDAGRQNEMGRVEQIFIKRVKRGPMDPASEATLVEKRGILGNANQGGRRQVTLLSKERWDSLMQALGADLDPRTRRANLVLSGVDLEGARGRVLRIGGCRLRINGATGPCAQMEAALPGLQAAMRHGWAGGAFAEVLAGGTIAVGDTVGWE
jgi:MOSC domain-containing protein YiiM